MKKLKTASFFAGIGGFDLGFEKAGFEVNFQCEIQPFCSDVLKRHWPKVKFASDISTVAAKDIPTSDVWCGGFPCQDLSVARGALKRHGLNGSRSGLFFHLAALAKAKKPRVILIENVHGLLSSNNGKDFTELLSTLDELGYAVSWRLLNSRYFGVPQSRPRIYICAWLGNPVAAASVLFEDGPLSIIPDERSAFLETSWVSGPGPITPKVAFCLAATSGRHTGTDWSRTYISYHDAVRRLTPLECERLQGFPDGWTAIEKATTDTERVDSLRYHALGNAVSVPVISWIASRIKSLIHNSPRMGKLLADPTNFSAYTLKRWPALAGLNRITGEVGPLRNSLSKVIWQSAGIIWNGTFISSRIPSSPNKPISTDLLQIIEKIRPQARYFLSPNAAIGILRRVDSQGRHLFPPLRHALERMAGREPTISVSPKKATQPEFVFTEPLCVSR